MDASSLAQTPGPPAGPRSSPRAALAGVADPEPQAVAADVAFDLDLVGELAQRCPHLGHLERGQQALRRSLLQGADPRHDRAARILEGDLDSAVDEALGRARDRIAEQDRVGETVVRED